MIDTGSQCITCHDQPSEHSLLNCSTRHHKHHHTQTRYDYHCPLNYDTNTRYDNNSPLNHHTHTKYNYHCALHNYTRTDCYCVQHTNTSRSHSSRDDHVHSHTSIHHIQKRLQHTHLSRKEAVWNKICIQMNFVVLPRIR